MPAQSGTPITPFPPSRLVHPAGEAAPLSLEGLAQQLAAQVAEAADADQWVIVVDGITGTSGGDLEELVPRPWLAYMNLRRPAVYRLSLPLRTGHRELGLVRLGTTDPAGFGPAQIARARAAANRAAEQLARRMDRDLGRRSVARERGSSGGSVVRLDEYRFGRSLYSV